MSLFNATAFIVDDADSSIVYSGNWQHLPSTPNVQPAEYKSTKSGTSSAGASASFSFTGTSIEVHGSQGSVDVFGQPVTTYTIDGVLAGTYHAPVIPSPQITVGTRFFASQELSPSKHELVITFTNATKLNNFWLDSIIYVPSSNLSPSQPPSAPSAPSSPSLVSTSQTQSPSSSHNPPSTPSAVSADSSPTTQPPSSIPPPSTVPFSTPSSSIPTSQDGTSSMRTSVLNTPVIVDGGFTGSTVSTSLSASATGSNAPLDASTSASSTKRTPAGAIAGVVIGGVVLLAALLLAALWYCHRRRQAPTRVPRTNADVSPFGSWRSQDHQPISIPCPHNLSPSSGSAKDPFSDPSLVRSTSASAMDPSGGGSSVAGRAAGGAPSPFFTNLSSTPSPFPTVTSIASPRTPGDSEKLSHQSEESQSALAQEMGQPIVTVTIPRSQPQPSVLSPIVRHHEDSGVRLPQMPPVERPVVDIPPAYTQV